MPEKKYYWLKLKRDFFKRHDMQIIEAMPNGKDYVLFYLKLLVESVDHDGELRFSDTIPYNEQMLATITNTNIDVVRSAMKIFTELNMIEVMDNQTIFMIEVQKMVGCETSVAERMRKCRERKSQKALPSDKSASHCYADAEKCYIEIDTEKEKELETEVVRGGFLSDSEADDLLQDAQQLNAVFDAAERAGFPHTEADLNRLNQIVADYHPEPVLNAIDRAVDAGTTTRTWRYLLGILKSDPTGGAKPKEEAYTPKPHWEDEG